MRVSIITITSFWLDKFSGHSKITLKWNSNVTECSIYFHIEGMFMHKLCHSCIASEQCCSEHVAWFAIAIVGEKVKKNWDSLNVFRFILLRNFDCPCLHLGKRTEIRTYGRAAHWHNNVHCSQQFVDVVVCACLLSCARVSIRIGRNTLFVFVSPWCFLLHISRCAQQDTICVWNVYNRVYRKSGRRKMSKEISKVLKLFKLYIFCILSKENRERLFISFWLNFKSCSHAHSTKLCVRVVERRCSTKIPWFVG